MVNLQRITVQYILSEDRIRLTGEDTQGQTWVLWMTQRILNRLMPRLCQWLEPQESDNLQASLRQAFAQQKARTDVQLAPPVKAQADSQALLVQSVDLKTLATGMALSFKDKDGQVFASLQLRPQALRNWLNIVYDQYLRAEWPTSMWPSWVTEAKQPTGAAVLH